MYNNWLQQFRKQLRERHRGFMFERHYSFFPSLIVVLLRDVPKTVF